MPLGRLGQIVVVAEKCGELKLPETIKDTSGARHFSPAEIAREPPRQIFGQLWQAPVAELRDDEWLAPRRFRIIMRAERPFRARRKICDPLVPALIIVGLREVLMEVVDVGLDVEIVATGAVVHDEGAAQHNSKLRAVKGFKQP